MSISGSRALSRAPSNNSNNPSQTHRQVELLPIDIDPSSLSDDLLIHPSPSSILDHVSDVLTKSFVESTRHVSRLIVDPRLDELMEAPEDLSSSQGGLQLQHRVALSIEELQTQIVLGPDFDTRVAQVLSLVEEAMSGVEELRLELLPLLDLVIKSRSFGIRSMMAEVEKGTRDLETFKSDVIRLRVSGRSLAAFSDPCILPCLILPLVMFSPGPPMPYPHALSPCLIPMPYPPSCNVLSRAFFIKFLPCQRRGTLALWR